MRRKGLTEGSHRVNKVDARKLHEKWFLGNPSMTNYETKHTWKNNLNGTRACECGNDIIILKNHATRFIGHHICIIDFFTVDFPYGSSVSLGRGNWAGAITERSLCSFHYRKSPLRNSVSGLSPNEMWPSLLGIPFPFFPPEQHNLVFCIQLP